MTRLVFARRARRELLELNWSLIDAIENALASLEREPQAGHALRGKLRGLCLLRVGAYRIIYQLTEGEQTVRVAAIRHRAVAYRGDPRRFYACQNRAGGMTKDAHGEKGG